MNSIHRATEDVALHAVVHVASSQVGLADLGLAKAKKNGGSRERWYPPGM